MTALNLKQLVSVNVIKMFSFESGGTSISAANGHSWLLVADMWWYETLREQSLRSKNILRTMWIFKQDLISMLKLFSIAPLLISLCHFLKTSCNQDWVTLSRFPILRETSSDLLTRFKSDHLKRLGMLTLTLQTFLILILLFEKDLIYLFPVLNLLGVKMLLFDIENQGCLTPYVIIIITFMEMKKSN